MDPKKIQDLVGHFYGRSKKELLGRTGNQKNEPRSMLIFLLRRLNGMSHAEIANVTKTENANAVSQVLYRFNKERRSNSDIDETVQTMTNNLLSYVKS